VVLIGFRQKDYTGNSFSQITTQKEASIHYKTSLQYNNFLLSTIIQK